MKISFGRPDESYTIEKISNLGYIYFNQNKTGCKMQPVLF